MEALPLNNASVALSDWILVDGQLDDLDIFVRPIDRILDLLDICILGILG